MRNLKKGLLSFSVAVFSLVLLEGASSIVWILANRRDDAKVGLTNSDDPEKRRLLLGSAIAENLAFTVFDNATGNPLLIPDRELLFRVRPNARHERVFGYSGINSQGFRGEEFEPLLRERDALRVMIIGDSCGFGWDIAAYEKTLGPVLAKTLERREKRKVAIFNLSQPGHSSSQQRVLFDSWKETIKPDVIVTYLGWNDIWETPRWTDSESMRIFAFANNRAAVFLRSTRLFDLMSLLATRLSARKADYIRRVPPEETLANYRRFAGLGRRIFVILPPHHLAVLPGAQPSRTALQMASYRQQLQEGLRESDIELVSLDETFSAARGKNDLFTEDGYHPNPEGVRLISSVLADKIHAFLDGAD